MFRTFEGFLGNSTKNSGGIIRALLGTGDLQGEIQKVSECFQAVAKDGKDAQGLYDSLSNKGQKLVDTLIEQADSEEDVADITEQLTEATKDSSKAFTLLNGAVTTIALWAFAEVLMAIINYENDLVNQLNEATSEFNKQNNAIDTYSNRVKGLYEKINSGQLTLEENVEANRELREIQKELTENFGSEASGIDLVTSSLEEQADVLEKINNLKGSEYMQTDFENNFNKQTGSQKVLSYAMTAANYAGLLATPVLPFVGAAAAQNLYENEGFIDQASLFGSNLDQMNKKYEQFSKKFKATTDETFNHVIESYDNIRRLSSGEFEIFGNVDKVKDTITKLQTNYKHFPGYTKQWADGLQNVWSAADDVVQKYGEAHTAQIQLNIASNEQYVAMQENLEAIYKEYEEATASGDKNGAEEAAKKYKEAIKEIQNSVSSKTYQEAIINIVPKIADVDYDNLKSQIQEILNSDYKDTVYQADVSVAFKPEVRNAYNSIETLYNNIAEELEEIGINSFNDFIDKLFNPDNLKRSEFRTWLNKEGYLKSSYGANPKYLDANAITSEDIELLEQYRYAIDDLGNDSLKASEELDQAFAKLSSIYGEDLAQLMTLIFSKENRIEWDEWLNDEEFNAILEAILAKTGLLPEQIRTLLTDLNLVNNSGVANAVWDMVSGGFNGQTKEQMKANLKDNVQSVVDELNDTWSSEELDILTLEEFKQFLETPPSMIPTIEELNKAKDAYYEYKTAVEAAAQGTPTISDAVKQFNEEMKPQFDTLASAYNQIFNNENGFAAGLKSVDIAWFESVRSSFGEIKDELDIDFDTTNIDIFFDALENGEQITEELAHKAFNDLATAYFYSADGLQNLNEETANSIEQMMKQMGVVNAAEIVKYYMDLGGSIDTYKKNVEFLNQSLEKGKELTDIIAESSDEYAEILTKASDVNKELGITVEDLTNADEEQIDAIQRKIQKYYEEIGATVAVRIAAFQLALQEYEEASVDLSPEQKIEDLEELANAYLTAGEAAAFTARMESLKVGLKYGGTVAREDILATLNDTQDLMNTITASIKDTAIDFASIGDAAGKGASDAADNAVDEFEEALKILDALKDQDLLSDKQYLDQKLALIKSMWASGKMSAQDYFQRIHDWLREMLDLYNKVLSDITKILDREIDKLEKERDQRLKEIEKEKKAAIDAIDEEISALDKRIKKKNEEIDILEKEHEQRKKNMDMARAQYNLMRSLYQRTNLVDLCQAS